MSSKELFVWIAGAEAGRVECDEDGQLKFVYTEAWRRRDDAIFLSLSMPLARPEHRHLAIHAYLWGLLPDNGDVLTRWGQRFHVSARNPFALLAHVGEDCAGAVQLVRPERREELAAEATPQVEWLAEAEIAARLRALREDPAAWRGPGDRGQFSLSGAQPKTALLLRDGRFGVPSGRTPTTHILKPPLRDRPGHAENEHLCLVLARELGLPAATSEVRRFGDELAIVVTRYDRVDTRALAQEEEAAAGQASKAAAETMPRGPAHAAALAAEAHASSGRAASLREAFRKQPVLRLHQEDMCQALSLLPTAKYQSEGGPSAAQIVGLLRDHSERPEEDVDAFVDALAFNWLIAGTDGHAKNYSLLHAMGGRVRLAPLYDLATALLHPSLDPQKLRLAMKVGSTYRLRDIVGRHWIDFAEELGLDAQATVDRIEHMASDLPSRLEGIGVRLKQEGLDPAVITKLVDVLTQHARRCTRVLAARGP